MSSFAPIYGFYSKALHSRYSSVVERVIGNDEAESPILSSGTSFNLNWPELTEIPEFWFVENNAAINAHGVVEPC